MQKRTIRQDKELIRSNQQLFHKQWAIFPVFILGLLISINTVAFGYKLFPFESALIILVINQMKVLKEVLSIRQIRFLTIILFFHSLGVVLTSIYYRISLVSALIESLNMATLYIDILGMLIIFRRGRIFVLLIGYLAGLIIRFLTSEQSFLLSWKFYIGICFVFIMIYYRSSLQRRKWTYIVWYFFIIALSIVSFINDSRLLGLLFLLSLIGSLYRSFMKGAISIGMVTVLVAPAILSIYAGYVVLVSNGYLGKVAFDRYIVAAENPYGVIFGARTNIAITFQYLLHSPIWGYGVNSEFLASSNFDSSLTRFSEQIALLNVARFSPHSGLLRSWYTGGILSFTAAISFYGFFLRKSLSGLRNYFYILLPIVVFYVVSVTVNPISGISRIPVAIAIGFFFFPSLFQEIEE